MGTCLFLFANSDTTFQKLSICNFLSQCKTCFQQTAFHFWEISSPLQDLAWPCDSLQSCFTVFSCCGLCAHTVYNVLPQLCQGTSPSPSLCLFPLSAAVPGHRIPVPAWDSGLCPWGQLPSARGFPRWAVLLLIWPGCQWISRARDQAGYAVWPRQSRPAPAVRCHSRPLFSCQ